MGIQFIHELNSQLSLFNTPYSDRATLCLFHTLQLSIHEQPDTERYLLVMKGNIIITIAISEDSVTFISAGPKERCLGVPLGTIFFDVVI